MICRHCGKEYSDEFEYCPYCAEPKPLATNKNEGYEAYKKQVINETVKQIFFCLLVSTFTIFINFLLYLILNVIIIVGLIVQAHSNLNDGKKRLIMEQHCLDQTSICPKCGSHNVKIYRKGYDYTTGYWLRKHGGAYIAGMDSNTACCRCKNCGNDWKTDYDYRLIKK